MRTKVFISYSHMDRVWLRRLQVHLKSLDESSIVLPWDDTRIKPGQNWRREIREALENAVAAVLLVSADFLASKFIKDNELPPLLDAAVEDGLTILPVILKPCRFRQMPSLESLEAVNDPARPMVNLSEGEQEAVWVKMVDCIAAAARQSSPEARLEVGLAQVREELRAHLLLDPFSREMREKRDQVLHDPSFPYPLMKQEFLHSCNETLRDHIIIFLSLQLADYQLKISTESGSHGQIRHWSNLLNAFSYELDRWIAIRGKLPAVGAEPAQEDIRRLDEAISKLLY